MSLETSVGRPSVLMPRSWRSGGICHLWSPLETSSGFEGLPEFGHVPPRHTDTPGCSCSVVTVFSAVQVQVSDPVLRERLPPAGPCLPPFQMLLELSLALILTSPTDLVCIRAPVSGLFSPSLGICASGLFSLGGSIQNTNSQYSSLFLFLSVKLPDSVQVAFPLIFLSLVENGDFVTNFLWAWRRIS